MVTLLPSINEEEVKVVASESLIVNPLIIVILFLVVCGTPWFFPIFGFPMLISCVSVSFHVLSLVFLSVRIYLDHCTRVHSRVNRLWPVTILTHYGTHSFRSYVWTTQDICVDASQSTSEHSVMDAWRSLSMEVL